LKGEKGMGADDVKGLGPFQTGGKGEQVLTSQVRYWKEADFIRPKRKKGRGGRWGNLVSVAAFLGRKGAVILTSGENLRGERQSL